MTVGRSLSGTLMDNFYIGQDSVWNRKAATNVTVTSDLRAEVVCWQSRQSQHCTNIPRLHLVLIQDLLQQHFSGPFTPTSRGWSACVVYDGRQNRITPRSLASAISFRLMWEAWPSMNRMTFPFCRMLDTAGKKSLKHLEPLKEVGSVHSA